MAIIYDVALPPVIVEFPVISVFAPKSNLPEVNVNALEIDVGLVNVTPLALLIVKLLAAVKAVPVICEELPL